MWTYFERCARNHFDSPLLFREPDVYAYICFIRDSSAAPTVAESFRQSVAFTANLFGSRGLFQDTINALESEELHIPCLCKGRIIQSRCCIDRCTIVRIDDCSRVNCCHIYRFVCNIFRD